MTVSYPKARKLGFSLILFSFLIAPGCCVHQPAIVAADRGIAGTISHMNNERLPQSTRTVATICHDVFWQIKFSLDGTELPEEVKARKAARDAAVEAGRAARDGEPQ